MGAMNRSLRKGKAKATSDGVTSRGSRGRHSVSSFPTIPDQFIGDGMTDEEFDQIYSGRRDPNLPTLDSLFENVDEARLDNLDRDEEPTPHSNDVDVEAVMDMCAAMSIASAEHSTVYVKLVTGTAIAWLLSHVGLDLTESRSNGWTTQRQYVGVINDKSDDFTHSSSQELDLYDLIGTLFLTKVVCL
ncbi:unnamed protein product [Cuscuta campestris]|uniref:Uncharacterized protein n=1 Tax=Cuscuta campestris TaxID=132261 RepID=A0A484NA93_9ASTE|nr:unnamed protein product [Cuscuta campestris]